MDPNPIPEWIGSPAWRMRVWLWRHSTVKGAGVCRRYGKAGGMVSVVSRGIGHATVKGTGLCRRVWVCPQCAGAVARERAASIIAACSLLDDPVMVTLTGPHVEGEALEKVWDRLGSAWRRMRANRYGWKGEFVRVTEVTTGVLGGWHPHLHVVVSGDDAPWLVNAWLNACRGSEYVAQKVSDDAREFAASYLAMELTGANWKGRSHWSLLRKAAGVFVFCEDSGKWTQSGDGARARAATLWREFEEVSNGRKWFVWSRKLGKAVRDLGYQTEDETEVEDEGTVLLRGDSEAWTDLCARGRGAAVVYAMGRAEAWDLRKLEEAFMLEVAPWIREATATKIADDERKLW